MSDANVVKLVQPGSFADPLTEVLRNGARALLAQAVETEVADFLAKHVDVKTATGLRRVVRHGHLPEREVMTGIGPVGVRQARRCGAEKLAQARWPQPVAEAHSRCHIHRWDRSRGQSGILSVPNRRRLNPAAVTKIRR